MSNAPPVPERAWDILSCPQCATGLVRSDDGVRCADCDILFGRDSSGALDLRLRQSRSYPMSIELTPRGELGSTDFGPLPATATTLDWSQFPIPRHLTPEMVTYIPAARPAEIALDLGCGHGDNRAACEHAGYSWLGLDFERPGASVYGDAHALPLADDSVDFILCLSVLEHIRYPFVMMREAFRVLKPGGRMLGSVAFLYPFHSRSLYHHSHLGTLDVLENAGFAVRHVAPTTTSRSWPVLEVAATAALFPKMPPALARAIVTPAQKLHETWWRYRGWREGWDNEPDRILKTAGTFIFVADKA